MTVTPTDVDGSTLTGTQPVSVVRPPMLAWANDLVAQPGVALSNVQAAAFTVPDGNDSTSEFTATINWGDGNTSSGTIQQVTGGLFQVLGSHTYATAGYYPLLVVISQGWLAQIPAAAALGLVQVGLRPNIMLYSVDFPSDPRDDGIILEADDLSRIYAPDQWLDEDLNGGIEPPDDHQFPYAIVSGSKLKVTAEFKVPKGFIGPAEIQIRGWVHAAEPGGEFFDSFDPETVQKGRLNQYSFTASTTNPLPKVTEGMPVFQINWEFSVDGQHWLPAGMSVNHLYLTYKQMNKAGAARVPDKLQTVFAYAASDSTAFSDNQDPKNLLDIIWRNFSSDNAPANARRALDNKQLHYYGNWQNANFHYPELVSEFDSQCGGWAELLLAAIAADGLNTVGWTVKYDRLIPLETTGYTGFLVKHWRFDNPKQDVNYLRTVEPIMIHSYNWRDPPAIQAHDHDRSGIPGQNVDNPKSLFENHQIIEVDMGNNVILYDPSYGKKYEAAGPNVMAAFEAALKQFQDGAIEGFYKQTPGAPVAPDATKLTIDPSTPKTPLELKVDPNRDHSYSI
jgi:hypothetical protein